MSTRTIAPEIEGQDLPLVAGADLSSDTYKFVVLDADNKAVLSGAAATDIVGVLQNAPAAEDDAAAVRGVGYAKVILGGTVAKGAFVTSDASGLAVTAGAAEVFAGKAVTGGVAGDAIIINLQHGQVNA